MIRVHSIVKNFGHHTILKDISFQIGEGECVALIGPNGAGKTTLLSCLIGDIAVNSGEITLNQLTVNDKLLKKIVGVLPQANVLPGNLKVRELIQFFQSIYDEALTDDEITNLLQFDERQYDQLANKLSGGQKRLLSFVLTLIGKPKILFLDEPTAAMDTGTRQRFWAIIDELKAKNVTIVYSSHYIEEVEHTADRILVIDKGSLLRDTTPFQMRSEKNEKRFILLNFKFKLAIFHDISRRYVV